MSKKIVGLQDNNLLDSRYLVHGHEYISDIIDNRGIYSTTEKKIGTWVDGKPLYRKVIQTGAIQSQQKEVAHNISNLGTVINLFGMAMTTNNTQFHLLPRVATSGNSTIALFASSTILYLGAGSNANFANSFVVMEYTKTTD